MNEKIFYFFYNLAHQNQFLDTVIVFFADTFPYLVIVAGGIFLLFHNDVFTSNNPFSALVKKYKEISLVFISGVAAWVFAHVFKFVLDMPRPAETFQDVVSLFEKTGNGFPSGHSAFFMAFALSIFFSHRRAGYVFIFCAFIIGIARIAAGVHFPGDIVGGYLLGGAIAYLIAGLRKRV